jgi:hypothetical protein
MSASATASAGYTINLEAVATPTFSPAGGTYTSSQTVTINDATAGANIYYTTNGSAPTATSGTLYTGSISVSSSETVSAVAIASGYSDSSVASAAYTINNAQIALVPTITSLLPVSATVGGAAFTLTVTGTNFVSGATVQWNATALTTTFVSSTQLAAAIPASLIAAAGTATVTVTDSAGTSSGAPLTINLGAPTIGSISPASATAGGAAFTLTVTGTNFVSGATALWNGATLTTSYVSATQLTAAVPAILIAAPGTANVTVVTLDGVSLVSTFAVNSSAPVLSSLNPTSGPVGSSVTITGTNFGATQGTSTVSFSGTAATSITSWGNTQIVAVVPTGATTGNVVVTVNTLASSGSAFTVLPAPTVTGVSPASGTTAGGTSVTITGTSFVGATAVEFGSTPATSFTVNSATSITAVSPAESAGTVDIKVVTSGGQSATRNADQFTYISAPTVTGVSLASGTTAGGTSVTITGTSFIGATAVEFGSTPATSFTVNSATSITAVSPAESAGTVDIRVVTPGGTSPTSSADQFTYAVPLPAVTGVSPTVGITAGGTSVTITGSNFTGATAVNFGGTGATSFMVNSATSITAVSPAGSGTVDIRVVTPTGTSAVATGDQFTYASGPAVDTINAASGPATGGTSVTVSGVNFTGATAVNFGGTAATSFTVNSATSITAVSPAGSGTVDIRVVGPGGTSAVVSADQFTYAPIPAVSGISPSSGSTAGGISVTISGTGFSGTNFTATAVNFGSVSATSLTVNSATSIIAVSPAESTGTVDIVVITPGGTSPVNTADRFTYVIPVPAVTGIAPTSGSTAGGATVGITGNNFIGATAVNFGSTAATSFTVNSATSITAVSPAESAGTVDVTVVTPSGTSATGSGDKFTYTVPAPALTGISPAVGVPAGGATVTITGTNFTGATAVSFGSTAAASFTVNSATSITAVSPAGSNGSVDITVVTPSGTSATVNADQFTYSTTIINGTAVSGSTPIMGAEVQLYAAGQSGYGVGSTLISTTPSTVTTDASGNFALAYGTCPSAPGDQLYLVVTTAGGGGFNGGTNTNIALMTALGSCSSLSASETVKANEVTTIASAYALSAFSIVNPSGGGIAVGAPALTGDTSCNAADNWQSTGKETCNYLGLSNAFKTVRNLVNIDNASDPVFPVGQARSYTLGYNQSLANDTYVVNNSTVPQARINTLANILAACVEDSSSDSFGHCGTLFANALPFTATGTPPPPVDTLQAALNIAQNPGVSQQNQTTTENNNVMSDLFSLQATTPPYHATTDSTYNPAGYLSAAPSDWTLALTYTGGGLGLWTNVPTTTTATVPNGPSATSTESYIGPTANTALAIDAAGNVWVSAFGENSLHYNSDIAWGTSGQIEDDYDPLLAEFNNQGVPQTSPTSVSSTQVNYGGISLASASLRTTGGTATTDTVEYEQVPSALAIDPSGNLWALSAAQHADLFTYSPSISSGSNSTGFFDAFESTSTTGGDLLTIDGSGDIWGTLSASGTSHLHLRGYSTTDSASTLPTDLTSLYSYSTGSSVNSHTLTIDSKGNLWFLQGNSLYPLNTATHTSLGANAFSGGTLAASGGIIPRLVADNSGNVYGCLDSGNTTGAIDLDVFNASSSPAWTNSTAPYELQNGTAAGHRGCGNQLVLDGQGHIFAVSNFLYNAGSSVATNIDEFTTGGAAISPLLNGYTGTSASEPPTLQTDLNFGGAAAGEPVPGISAAIDGSGNLWVLNVDTIGTTGTSAPYSSTTAANNVLVEYVGIGAPVATPTSVALQNSTLGVRP